MVRFKDLYAKKSNKHSQCFVYQFYLQWNEKQMKRNEVKKKVEKEIILPRKREMKSKREKKNNWIEFTTP